MSPDEVLALYKALKLHFTTKYDYFAYHGKLKPSRKAYDTRSDKGYIFRLSRMYRDNELQGLIIANLLHDANATTPVTLVTDDAKKVYNDWLAFQQSFTYNFKAELERLLEEVPTFYDLITGQPNEHPGLLKAYLGKRIRLETLIVLLYSLGMHPPYWDTHIKDDIVWPQISRLIKKYRPFLNYNEKDITKEVIVFVKKFLDKRAAMCKTYSLQNENVDKEATQKDKPIDDLTRDLS